MEAYWPLDTLSLSSIIIIIIIINSWYYYTCNCVASDSMYTVILILYNGKSV